MQWVTTTLVLDRLQDSEDEAWETFVHRFRQPVVRFAREMGLAADDAEDAAQDALTAFLVAYRAGKYDRGKGRLHSWLFGIAQRTILDRRRRLAKEHRRAPLAQQTAIWDAIPQKAVRMTWDRSWQQAVFDQCLAQVRVELEPKTIQAFELVALRDVPAEEAAEELGMTRNAVFLAKHRVLKRIRELQIEIEAV
ncbi:MAG: RNA polymerase sigma factor [Phycisphaerales bacterium]|nr:RNA polymerase sigma factor [Phycisphaerales bacterium]